MKVFIVDEVRESRWLHKCSVFVEFCQKLSVDIIVVSTYVVDKAV